MQDRAVVRRAAFSLKQLQLFVDQLAELRPAFGAFEQGLQCLGRMNVMRIELQGLAVVLFSTRLSSSRYSANCPAST
jgi:hypothetical protein